MFQILELPIVSFRSTITVSKGLGSKDLAGIHLLKVNNRNIFHTRCETCSELRIKAPERRQLGIKIVLL